MSKGLKSKSYTLGLTKEPYEPIDLKAIYEKVRKRKDISS